MRYLMIQPCRLKWMLWGAALLTFFTSSYSQQLTGEVVDKLTGTPIEFANVSIEGSSVGTYSGVDGAFELNLPSDSNAVILISYVGYRALRIPWQGQVHLRATLEPVSAVLDDIVVVAYGQMRKSDLTGSISSISSTEISQVAPISVDQALQARAAGVQVTQVSGRPGGETSIRIRGAGSVNAGNEPLYVIDGMIMTTDNGETNVGAVAASPLNALAALNPSDIASIEILKDASATALYGSRGSNGVVLITTKRGQQGVSTISFDTYAGVQEVARQLDLLNGEQFAHYINAYNRDARLPTDPRYIVPERYGAGTDWQRAIFRPAVMHNYQLNISGGGPNTNYAVSGGYTAQDGIIINSDFRRYNFRLNLDQVVNDRIKVGTSSSISYIQSSGVLTGALSPGTGVLLPGATASAILFPPTLSVLDDRVRGGYTFQDDRGRNIANPVADARETDNLATNLRAITSAFLQVKLAEGLQFKANLGADLFAVRENRYVPNFLKRTEANNGEAVLGAVNGYSWLAEYTLTYDKAFGGRHQINTLLGNTYQRFQSERLFVIALDFPDNRSRYHNLGNSLNPQPPANGETTWGILSYLGRVNYALDNKYLITVTGRVDGSSKFGADNKYGFFPSIAGAWKLHEEDFMANLGSISTFKVRASYGTVGNQEIPPFTSLATVGPVGEGVFNSTEIYKGQEPLRFPNPRLRWERTSQLDVGVDVELWRGRLAIVLDYYDKNTKDLLLFTPLPTTTGFSGYLSNVGGLRNRGIEVAVVSRNIASGDWNWNTLFNISRNRNKISALAGNDDIPVGGVLTLPAGWSILRVGQPLGTFFGYRTAGILQSDEQVATAALLRGQAARPGDRYYHDINGRDAAGVLTGRADGVIDEADRTTIGDANPDFIWGMSNNVSWRKFDLNIFLQGVFGNDVVNAYLFEVGGLTGETNILTEFWENRWTVENPSTTYARVNPSERNIFSDAQVEDGSFIRFRNITLGYRYARASVEGKPALAMRFYLTANNLLTLTRYRGYDPEVFAFGQNSLLQGVDYGGYPLARSLIFGVQMTL